MVTSDGSAKKKGRPWGSKTRNQSKKAAKKRKRKSSRTNKNFAHKKGLSGIISSATKTSYRKADLVSRRKYIIKKMPCLHLTAEMRKILQTAWNAYINSSTTITIRHFALVHGLSTETWRRELKRGALGLIQRKGNKWLYPEYSADKAIDSINEGKSNMGTKMKMTVAMAMMFRHFVKNLHRSPSDARAYIVKALPEAYIPCLRTFYNHIYSGDMGVYHGETPYHPGRRRKPRQLPHPAKTVPGRRSIADRPNAALARLEIGHWEMDTIVSGRSGKGGLLVLVDRCSRKYLIEHINYISQDEVLSALRKMRRRNAFEIVRSVTTDNGCEFLDQKRLDRFFKAQTYYTRAYAAWEKGSVENANRIVRRFYPKGTNFNLLTRGQILQLENFINSIHRQSLNGETANDYHSRLAKAV